MKTYGIENATLVATLYAAKVTLHAGERHCLHCRGYGIRPIPLGRGHNIRSQRHQDCDACGGTGKWQADE